MSEIDTSRGAAEPGQPPRRPDRGVRTTTARPSPVIDLAARRRQAAARPVRAGEEVGAAAEPIVERPAGDRSPDGVRTCGGEAGPDGRTGAAVEPLNDAAAIYDALADQIRGSAVGWSDTALAQLERGLFERYGPLIGGRHPVRRLVRLAARPPAA